MAQPVLGRGMQHFCVSWFDPNAEARAVEDMSESNIPELLEISGLHGRRATAAETKRYLFYSHDGVGLGHTARNLAIARALAERDPDATILLATGTDDALQLGVPERVEILKLPSLRKIANERYAARRLLLNERQIHSLRSDLLAGTVRSFQPHVMLVDKHPLGAGGELRSALSLLQQQGGAAVLGLRDILDEPEVVVAEWSRHNLRSVIAEFYDRILIYGEPDVFNPVTEYSMPATLAARTLFCGYVINDATTPCKPMANSNSVRRKGRPRVVATVGGGEDGGELLEQFLHACVGAPWSGVAVSGPFAQNGAKARLFELAGRSKSKLFEFVPNLWRAFEPIDALVCMGGYNTLCEGLAHSVPIVCVPRVHPRREQYLRAECFSRLGLLEFVDPEMLSAPVLRDAVLRALSRPSGCTAARLNFAGAIRAAEMLSTLAYSVEERDEFAWLQRDPEDSVSILTLA